MIVFGGWAERSDFLYMNAIFGFDAPGRIYGWIFSEAVPNFVQAMIGGFVAVWLMEKIARGANYTSAAMITGALYTGFLICLFAISIPTIGLTSDTPAAVLQCIGLWIGLMSAATTLPAPKGAVV